MIILTQDEKVKTEQNKKNQICLKILKCSASHMQPSSSLALFKKEKKKSLLLPLDVLIRAAPAWLYTSSSRGYLVDGISGITAAQADTAHSTHSYSCLLSLRLKLQQHPLDKLQSCCSLKPLQEVGIQLMLCLHCGISVDINVGNFTFITWLF